MGKEDRIYLAAYLKAKELSENSEFTEACSCRLKEMQSGHRLNSFAVRDLHHSLLSVNL
jgi:hypothetical protein